MDRQVGIDNMLEIHLDVHSDPDKETAKAMQAVPSGDPEDIDAAPVQLDDPASEENLKRLAGTVNDVQLSWWEGSGPFEPDLEAAFQARQVRVNRLSALFTLALLQTHWRVRTWIAVSLLFFVNATMISILGWASPSKGKPYLVPSADMCVLQMTTPLLSKTHLLFLLMV